MFVPLCDDQHQEKLEELRRPFSALLGNPACFSKPPKRNRSKNWPGAPHFCNPLFVMAIYGG